ncbi:MULTISPECIES: HAD family hydrolase [unclassified Nocardioides]|uniref:HAD family hydrolase n=1 Tax=unclassified Nocardioides TaxID=2615069 RepID=UPI001F3E5C9F|nr:MULTISPECIES: HAD family hydrolase [unclassified Nocardioides]
MTAPMSAGIDAVIFDWGGTLTRWHDIDFHAESLALAQAVVNAEHDIEVSRARLHQAGDTVWGRSRDHQQSATVADLFTEAGLEHDPDLLTAYYEFWEPHTLTDPEVGPLFDALRTRGVKVGVLSNTIWPRAWHEGFFRRDGVLDRIDGDVYTSEIAWTKPSPHAFRAAMDAVGASDPSRCVYVGDRLFDDVWGAQNAGLRAIHVPHSVIPSAQVGHSEGTPDAVVHALSEIPALVDAWS